MHKIEIKELEIKNFKGIKEQKIEFDGSTKISGKNGAGKTTIYDAFLWILFSKDSTGKTNFDWKPLDKNGKEINRLETTVSIKIMTDGTEEELKKTTKEKWTRKRGSARETFTGHTTDYYIDGLKVKKSEFENNINEKIDEKTFQMLTNTQFFAEDIHWTERREKLLEISGGIAPEELAKNDPELKNALEKIGDTDPEKIAEKLKQQLRNLNKQLKELPARIDEVNRSLIGEDLGTQKEIKEQIKHLEKEKEKFMREQKETPETKREKEIEKAKIELEKEKNKRAQKTNEKLAKLRAEHQKIDENINNISAKELELKSTIQQKENEARWLEKEINHNKERIEQLREDFISTQNEKFELGEINTHCPTCEQELSEKAIEKIIEEKQVALTDHNIRKAEKLKQINAAGKKRMKDNNQKENELLETKKEIQKLEKEIDKTETEKAAAVREKKKAVQKEKELQEAQETTKEKELQEKIESLISSIDNDKTAGAEQQQINEITKEIEELNEKLAKIIANDLANKRYNELVKEEQEVSKAYGRIEDDLLAVERFITKRAEVLTEKINEKFSIVKFQLFKENINGGIEEICEATVNGANYTTGLNTAARVNAGIDIINTLSKHEGVSAPIFIDNSESINDIIETDAQLILLEVTTDEKLKIEKMEEK